MTVESLLIESHMVDLSNSRTGVLSFSTVIDEYALSKIVFLFPRYLTLTSYLPGTRLYNSYFGSLSSCSAPATKIV